ncbi:protein kinase family protein [Bacillaceae bacterium Marseille-Q3522]|nr:protein kinase family protein [Bacillaceae bacterium Marseille-Q3522]
MMNPSLKNPCKFPPGTVVEGKWHQQRYVIVKELGSGANGVVYLAQFAKQQVALKLSDNGMSVTSEVNVLKSFAKVQGSPLGPALFDVDDWEIRGNRISFYAMEYIHGPDLLTFLKEKGPSWIEVLMIQLLKDLQSLHENGWIFGDLKPENLIVTGPPARIRCIDVGGTTLQGRAIKEFTEFYDRGYWGLGSRKAEPGYDLFAVAMIIINTAYPKRFKKLSGGINELRMKIRQHSSLHKYETLLLKALQGQYQTAVEMKEAFFASINGDAGSRQTPATTRAAHKTQKRQTVQGKKRRKKGLFETICIIIIVFFLYMAYIYHFLL